MGRERNRTRKFIYFCTACLIISSLFGCAVLQQIGFPGKARRSLSKGQSLYTKKNYDGALVEFKKILALSSEQPFKDEALFYIGLIYVHSGNPHRDVEKSLEAFKWLVTHYPDSPLAEQAKIWASVLEENRKLSQTIQKLKKVDIEIEKMRRIKKTR